MTITMRRFDSSSSLRTVLLALAALLLCGYASTGDAARPPSPPKAKKPPSPPKVKKPPSPPKRGFSNLRLVRGASSSEGRLEVLISDYYSSYNDKPTWRPVCNDGSINPDDSQMFCTLLGYKYGVPYVESGVTTFDPSEKHPATPVLPVECDFYVYDESIPNGHRPFRGYPRRLLPLSFGNQTCSFSTWSCGTGSQLVGLQCSDSPLPPVPSPPPRPPSPPPPPPDMTDAIRVIYPEPNLEQETCANIYSGDMYNKCGRVELLVNTSADGRTGPAVWAPLCADSAGQLSYDLTSVICNQFMRSQLTPYIEYLFSHQTDAIPIPKGNIPADGFRPAKCWVSVAGDVSYGQHAVQASPLKVSSKPCASGYMAAVICTVAIA